MRAWFAGLIWLFAATTAHADPAHPLQPAARWAHDGADLKPDAAVRYGVLPNGMRYAILRNETPKGRAAVRLRIGLGALQEQDNQAGLAHFLEHMAFNGSKNVPEGEMIKILERKGLAFGPDTNAYTSFDETVYMLDLPSVDADMLDTALMLMRETAGNLTLSDSAIEKERGVIVAEERARATPNFRMFEAWMKFAMAGVRVPERFPIGSMDVVRNATRERFLELYQGYYRPEQGLLVVVGDIDPDAIEAQVRAKFSDWTQPGAPGPLPDMGAPSAAPGSARVFVDPGVPTVMWISTVAPLSRTPDSQARRLSLTLESLASAVVNRRLERIARRAGAPFVSAGVSGGSRYKSADIAQLQIVAEPGKWREALAAADAELRRALQFGFTEAEFAQEIAELRQGLKVAADQAGTRQSMALANAIVGAFNDAEVFTNPKDDFALFQAVESRLTAAAAWEAMKARWGDRTPTVFLATSAPVEGGDAALKAAFDSARAAPVEAAAAEATVAWAYTDFGAPGRVVSRRPVRGLDAEEITFANNVRLIVKQTPFEDNSIRVQARIGQGLLDLPMDRPGVEIAAENAFIAGGLGRHEPDALERALAGKSVGATFSVAENAFVLNGATTPEHALLQLQLMTAYASDPGWRDDALARLRAALDLLYRQLNATPAGVSQLTTARVLRGGDARFSFPPRAALEAITIADLRAAIDPALQGGPVEITIVGDITPERAIEIVAQTFGALPQRAPGLLPRDAQRAVRFGPPRAEPVRAQHQGRADQAVAGVYWQSVDFADRRRARLTRIVEQVLQLKLTAELRERDGLTYSPGTAWDASTVFPGFGFIGAVLEVNPKDIPAFYAAAEKIAADMAAGRISADEFDRARVPLIKGVEGGLRQNATWMTRLAGGAFDPGQLDRARTVLSDYQTATLAEVRALAAEVFAPERSMKVEITPAAAPVP